MQDRLHILEDLNMLYIRQMALSLEARGHLGGQTLRGRGLPELELEHVVKARSLFQGGAGSLPEVPSRLDGVSVEAPP